LSADGSATPISEVGAGAARNEVSPGDTARAETLVPLPAAELVAFVADVERLWRLNPHLDIRDWQPREDGFNYVAHDEIGDCQREAQITFSPGPDAVARSGESCSRMLLRYAGSLRQATEILVEPAPEGTRLILIDHYPRIEDPQDPRLAEVDRTLVPWVGEIRRHLLARRRWGWLPGWRWWNEHFLLHMAPRSRRIVRLLVWISVLEFAVFVAAVAVLRLAS
jgi:hypothetical protein